MESIEVSRKRFGYFPRTFEWQGKQYEVAEVIGCWTFPELRHGINTERHYFVVKTDKEYFILYQEIADGSWHVLT